MLNTQRLIDAGFTDDDMSTLMVAFETTMNAMKETIKEFGDDLPFNNDMVNKANEQADRILDRISKYKSSFFSCIDDAFSIWAHMAMGDDES